MGLNESPARAKAFRAAFEKSKNIVAIAGHDYLQHQVVRNFMLSEYSLTLVSTFVRHSNVSFDGGGMWRPLNAIALATPEAFNENPSLVWKSHHYRRAKYVSRHTTWRTRS